MISISYVSTMVAYNSEMNRRLYAAAARLSDEERRRDRGAFWRSIHGTFSHLVWADRMWMSRLAGWTAPTQPGGQSADLFDDFETMAASRVEADAAIELWADALGKEWLAGDQTWFSGLQQQELTMPRPMLLMHIFNHQTHHRGQAHAMLTAAGQRTGDTDLWLVVPPSH